MDILPIILIFVSSALHTYWNYALKKAINKGAQPLVLYWLSAFFGVIIYSVFFLIFVKSLDVSFYGLLLAAVCGFLLAVYSIFLGKSYESGDLSQVYPLSKITPLFTLIIGVFYLQESVSKIGFLGIFLVILGVYSIHLKDFRLGSFFKPVLSLKSKASMLALFTAVVSAIYGLFSKLGVVEMNPLLFVYAAFVFMVLSYIPFVFRKNITSHLRSFKKSIVKIGFIDILSYGLVVVALSLSQLSYVFTLRQVSILFSVLVGVYFLKEKYGVVRIIASVITAIGIVLISIS